MKLTNHTLHPFHMVIVQILHDNPDSTISDATVQNFTFRNLKDRTPLEGEEPQRNATIEIDLLGAPSDVEGDWVEFAYHRYDLQVLFNSIIAEGKNKVNEWDVVTDDNGVILSGFELELEKKFNLYMEESDKHYDFIYTPYKAVIRAKADNPAFIGEVEFDVVPGLKSRVYESEVGSYQTPYQPPEFASELVASPSELVVGETLTGSFDVWSQHDFDFVLLLDKDYPDLDSTNQIEVRRVPMLATSVIGGVDTERVDFTLTTDEIAAVLAEDAGRLEDGYVLKVRAVNSAGNATQNHRMFVGYDITNHLSVSYVRSDIVDESTARAIFKLTTDKQLDVTIGSVGGNTAPSYNGIVVEPSDVNTLIPGNNMTVTIDFNRGENVPVTLNFAGAYSLTPGPFRVPYFGEKEFSKTVSLKTADVPTLTGEVTLDKQKYLSGDTLTATQTVTSEADYAVKVYATKEFQPNNEVLVKSVNYTATTELGGTDSKVITTAITTAELETALGSNFGMLEDNYTLRYETVNEAGSVDTSTSTVIGMNIEECQVMTFVRTLEQDFDTGEAEFNIKATHNFSAKVEGLLGQASLSIKPNAEGVYDFIAGNDYKVIIPFDRDSVARNLGIKLVGTTNSIASATRVPTFSQTTFTHSVSMGPTPPPRFNGALTYSDKVEIGGYLTGTAKVVSEDAYKLEVYLDKASVSGLGNRVIKVKEYNLEPTTPTGGSTEASVPFSVSTDEIWAAHDPLIDGNLADHYLLKVRVVNEAGESSDTGNVVLGYDVTSRFAINSVETREYSWLYGTHVFVLNCIESFRAKVNVTGNNVFRINNGDPKSTGSLVTFEKGVNYELSITFPRDGKNKTLGLDIIGDTKRPDSGDYTPYWNSKKVSVVTKMNPTPKPVVSNLTTESDNFTYGEVVSGNIRVLSEDNFRLKVYLTKEYPGTSLVTNLLIKDVGHSATTEMGGSGTRDCFWGFTANELRSVLPANTGNPEDIYKVRVEAVNGAGGNSLETEVLVGYDLANRYSFTYNQNYIVDRDTGRAKYTLTPTRDITLTFGCTGGKGYPRIGGVATAPTKLLNLKSGVAYTIEQDFARGGPVDLSFVGVGAIDTPSATRVPFFGTKPNNHRVHMPKPKVEVLTEEVSGTKTTYEETKRVSVDVKCEIGYTIKWYIDGNLFKTHTQTTNTNVRRTFFCDYKVPTNKTYNIKVIYTADNGISVQDNGSIVRKLKPVIVTPPNLNGDIYTKANNTLYMEFNAREDCFVSWRHRKKGTTNWVEFKRESFKGQVGNRTCSAVYNQPEKGDWEFNAYVRLNVSKETIGTTFFRKLLEKITVGGTIPWHSNVEHDWNSCRTHFKYTPSVTSLFRIVSVGDGEAGPYLNGSLVKGGTNHKLVAGTTYTISVDTPRDGTNHNVAIRLTPVQDPNLPYNYYVGVMNSSKTVNMAPTPKPSVTALNLADSTVKLGSAIVGTATVKSEDAFTARVQITKEYPGTSAVKDKIVWTSQQPATTTTGGNGTRVINWSFDLDDIKAALPSTGIGRWDDYYVVEFVVYNAAGAHQKATTVAYGQEVADSQVMSYSKIRSYDIGNGEVEFKVTVNDDIYIKPSMTGIVAGSGTIGGNPIDGTRTYHLWKGSVHTVKARFARGANRAISLILDGVRNPTPGAKRVVSFGRSTFNRTVNLAYAVPVVNSTNVQGTPSTVASSYDFNINCKAEFAYTVKWYLDGVLKRTDTRTTNTGTNATYNWNTGTISTGSHSIKVVVTCGTQTVTKTATLTRNGVIEIVNGVPSTMKLEQGGDTIGIDLKVYDRTRVRFFAKKKSASSWNIFKDVTIEGSSIQQRITGNFLTYENSDFDFKWEAYYVNATEIKASQSSTVIPFKRVTTEGFVRWLSLEEYSATVTWARFEFYGNTGATYKLEHVAENHGKFRVNGNTFVNNLGTYTFPENGRVTIDIPFPKNGANHNVGVRLIPQNSRYIIYSGAISGSKVVYSAPPKVNITTSVYYGDGNASFTVNGRVSMNFTPTNGSLSYRATGPGVDKSGGTSCTLPANGSTYDVRFAWNGRVGETSMLETKDGKFSKRSSFPKFRIVGIGSNYINSTGKYNQYVRVQLDCYQTNLRFTFDNSQGMSDFDTIGEGTSSTRHTLSVISYMEAFAAKVKAMSDQGTYTVNQSYNP